MIHQRSKIITNQRFGEERALYGETDLLVKDCSFDGPEDGESALKEASHITVESCFCNLRYPFWHDTDLAITGCELTPLCRAALWYSENISITDTKLHGIKALRECANVSMTESSIQSTEFGWLSHDISLKQSSAEGEYFMLHAKNLAMEEVQFKGKYSFQYVENAYIKSCTLDTKDAFWHSKHVTVENCTVKGEYLAWYSEDLTMINCKIIGTQPFCYCKNLRLVNCEMIDTDLAFERSSVEATILTPVDSIKNPYSGFIQAPSAKLILDDPNAKCSIQLESPAL